MNSVEIADKKWEDRVRGDIESESNIKVAPWNIKWGDMPLGEKKWFLYLQVKRQKV